MARAERRKRSLLIGLLCLLTISPAIASIGDRLPDFRECLQVCKQENCDDSSATIRKPDHSSRSDYVFDRGSHFPALHHRLLLWTCPAECDYACQHIITQKRLNRDPPMLEPIVQYHGKWPFHRFLGMQEPFSVLFSLFNYLAHRNGMKRLRERIPSSYPLMPYYAVFGYFGLASWVFSMIFHTRDFGITEKMDYFAAGASVLYGLYYTPIRVFRLDQQTPQKQSFLRAWTVVCCLLYTAHVSYLTLWSWDYTYNMAANVVVGVVQNLLWSWFSITRYRRLQKSWAAWPGMIVAWIIMAMSLELFDFPPWGGMVDAHSLWHLGTVVPTVWWYSFLIKDAQEDLAGERLKQ